MLRSEYITVKALTALETEFAIDQIGMAFKQWLHALRKASDQREKEAQFSCVSFHPIHFKADTVFFFLFGVASVEYWMSEGG